MSGPVLRDYQREALDAIRSAAARGVTLAERVRAVAEAAPPRTPERRAAAALHSALITTKTTEAAVKALRGFTDTETRAAAVALLGQLEREAAL